MVTLGYMELAHGTGGPHGTRLRRTVEPRCPKRNLILRTLHGLLDLCLECGELILNRFVVSAALAARKHKPLKRSNQNWFDVCMYTLVEAILTSFGHRLSAASVRTNATSWSFTELWYILARATTSRYFMVQMHHVPFGVTKVSCQNWGMNHYHKRDWHIQWDNYTARKKPAG